MDSQWPHFPPVVLKEKAHLPRTLGPHYRPPKGINCPLLQICKDPDGQSNIIHRTTGTDIESVIVPNVLATGACQVRGGTGNIPPPHGNGFNELPAGDQLPRSSPGWHQLHLQLGHFIISDAPHWPGIVLELHGKKGWDSNKAIVEMH